MSTQMHPSGLGIDVRLDMHDDVRRVVALAENARWELSAYAAARPLREFVEFAEPLSPAEIVNMPEYLSVAAVGDAYWVSLHGPRVMTLLEFAEKASAALLATELPAVRYSRQQVSASEQQQWSDARKLYAAASAQ